MRLIKNFNLKIWYLKLVFIVFYLEKVTQKKLNILMVDDGLGNISAIKILLIPCNDLGVKICFKSVNDGTDSIKQFKNRNSTLSIDNIHIIIMDYNMKIMNGDLATKEVTFINQR